MAIDQEIQRKVDAYRSNPQALQQRYAQNQQLIDLLALQKLKSEKDAAAKQMQLQMAQNPQTIKQQRERELLDRTKQEMMQQQAGIMQTAQQRQQQNMQRVANQGVAAPQQAQPKGLGSLGGQQRPPVARMASGGIVAFQEGGATTYPGGITQADVEEYKRKNAGQLGGKTDLEIAKLLAIYASRRKRIDEATAPLEEGSRAIGTGGRTALGDRTTKRPDVAPYQSAMRDLWNGSSPTEPAQTDIAIDAKRPSPAGMGDYGPDSSDAIKGPSQPPAQGAVSQTREQTPPPGQSGVSGIGTLTAPKIDLSNVGQMGERILGRTGLGSIQDPDAMRTKRMDEAAAYMGRQRVADRMQDYLKQLGALDAQQTDPAKLRREEILAGLRGAANTGSFGGAMAGVSRGMAEARKAQEKSQRDRLLKTIELDQAAMGLDIDMAKTGLAEGRSAAEQVYMDRRRAAQVLSTMNSTQIQAAVKQAELDYNADRDNIQNTLEARKIELQDSLQRAIRSADNRNAAAKTLVQIQKEKQEIRERLKETFQPLKLAKRKESGLDEDASQKEIDEVQAAVTAAEKAFEVYLNTVYEAKKGRSSSINDIEEMARKLYEGDSELATRPTQANFNISSAGQAALARNLSGQ